MINRRRFVQLTGAGLTALGIPSVMSVATSAQNEERSSAQTKKIVVFDGDPDTVRDFQSLTSNILREFQSAKSSITIVPAEPGRAIEQVADADAILGTISPELFRAGKRLKWVQVYSAGVEKYRFPEFINSDVTLTNCKIIQGPEIADHAFGFLLALTRDLYRVIPTRTREEWEPDNFHPIELRGKTAVIVGVGGIGSQIARRAQAFGMNVIGVDPKDFPLDQYVSKMVYPDQLDEVLPQADVAFISAPHTPQSEGMIGPKQFEEMKLGAYFIAVSRGKLYNTEALVKALDSGQLAGAGLDVTDPEPLPKGHALWKFQNVIITPHIATLSDQLDLRRMALIKENIARFVKGEPQLNVVDKQKGY
jgi:phosphoglycerate dehydrogenase-like enzyme